MISNITFDSVSSTHTYTHVCSDISADRNRLARLGAIAVAVPSV